MSEASGRTEMERRLIERSIEDESFRQRLIEDPKGAVEQELGTRLPEEVRVVAVEETADTIYLVLPSTPMAGAEGGELSDRELESVAGGWEHLRVGLTGDVPRRLTAANVNSRFHLIGVALGHWDDKATCRPSGPSFCLIHRSAWKAYSPKSGCSIVHGSLRMDRVRTPISRPGAQQGGTTSCAAA